VKTRAPDREVRGFFVYALLVFVMAGLHRGKPGDDDLGIG
jgi:hypothetical protein